MAPGPPPAQFNIKSAPPDVDAPPPDIDDPDTTNGNNNGCTTDQSKEIMELKLMSKDLELKIKDLELKIKDLELTIKDLATNR